MSAGQRPLMFLQPSSAAQQFCSSALSPLCSGSALMTLPLNDCFTLSMQGPHSDVTECLSFITSKRLRNIAMSVLIKAADLLPFD